MPGSDGGEIAMDEGDGHGAFPDGGGAALDRAVADIARGEESGHAGF